MAANKGKNWGSVGLQIEAPSRSASPTPHDKEPTPPPSCATTDPSANLPTPLNYEEKRYLLAVERGDMANVRRILQRAHRKKHIDINCVDPFGRSALTLSIDNENLEMVELLVIMGVQTKDALLMAINAEFVEAVELLLEHEELIYQDGEPYSWQKVDLNVAMFTPDVTPLMLAAHRNNYEILKILLDRGATIPVPHDIKCGCDDCIRLSGEDPLRHSLSRVNVYRALSSPSLISLSSNDPMLTAFQLSWELRTLAFTEQECKSEYLELRKQCQQFAVNLLDQSRSSKELAVILNYDPESPPYEDGDQMKLARLELAINYKQKKFVAHPNIQQLLAALWYDGVPGFRRKKALEKCVIIARVALLFPIYCILYMIAPNTTTGKVMKKPFMKFLIHASSYLFFLLILILVSQRAEFHLIQLIGTKEMQEMSERQRGNPPTPLEYVLVVYVLGYIWEEMHEIYIEGYQKYLRNMWNFIDFTRNFLYIMVMLLRAYAYFQQNSEIENDPTTANIPREHWEDFDPQLIAEGLFAAANIFSALKLVHLFSINPHLGPLQISLGRMVIDIVKFFFIYSLVLFAFACGLNQLLWYFADLEKQKCYSLPNGEADWNGNEDACMKWRRFGNLFESSQSLFWASFGMVDLGTFELEGIKSYTRFWGLLMFGSYSVINVIVLLNLLIAMMSNSYAMIDQHSDTEWKFARTKLWLSYFDESATLPPPFNILPNIKWITRCCRKKKNNSKRASTIRRREEKARENRYTNVMRALVWRYISAMHRKAESNIVTEDDINEVKADISTMRFEMLEIFERSGFDVSAADKKEKMVVGKSNKVWERRLMKDFHVAPQFPEDEVPVEAPPANETSLARFRRIAKQVAHQSIAHKWGEVVKGVTNSQIGRTTASQGIKNQRHLKIAMQEAKRFVAKSPIPRSESPIDIVDPTSHTLLELLRDLTEETTEMDVLYKNTPSPAMTKAREIVARASPPKEEVNTKSAVQKFIKTRDTLRVEDAERVFSPPPQIEVTQHEIMRIPSRSVSPNLSSVSNGSSFGQKPLSSSSEKINGKISPKNSIKGSTSKGYKCKAPVCPTPPSSTSDVSLSKSGILQTSSPESNSSLQLNSNNSNVAATQKVTCVMDESQIICAVKRATTPKMESTHVPSVIAGKLESSAESVASSGSMEKLITTKEPSSDANKASTSPPTCLKSIRIADEKPVRRQPKTGWL